MEDILVPTKGVFGCTKTRRGLAQTLTRGAFSPGDGLAGSPLWTGALGGSGHVNQISTGLLYGLDSLLVGTVLGTRSPKRWLSLAAALGLADGLASLAGHTLSGIATPAWAVACGPVMLTAYAACAFLAVTRTRALATHRPGIVFLPFALSLDNFVGAAAFDAPAARASAVAVTMALASFLLAYAGCALGGALAGRWPAFVRPFAAGATLAAAAAMTLA
jgi:hypothetical protein